MISGNKNIIMTLAFVLLVFTIAAEKPCRTEAKTQDGTYYFSSCMTTRFQVKNGKLTLKVSKDGDSGITRKNDENYRKYKLTVKVAKNCRYLSEEFSRYTGKTSSSNADYGDVKKLISEDRSFYKETGDYCNFNLSRVIVKNNRAVKIVYAWA